MYDQWAPKRIVPFAFASTKKKKQMMAPTNCVLLIHLSMIVEFEDLILVMVRESTAFNNNNQQTHIRRIVGNKRSSGSDSVCSAVKQQDDKIRWVELEPRLTSSPIRLSLLCCPLFMLLTTTLCLLLLILRPCSFRGSCHMHEGRMRMRMRMIWIRLILL